MALENIKRDAAFLNAPDWKERIKRFCFIEQAQSGCGLPNQNHDPRRTCSDVSVGRIEFHGASRQRRCLIEIVLEQLKDGGDPVCLRIAWVELESSPNVRFATPEVEFGQVRRGTYPPGVSRRVV